AGTATVEVTPSGSVVLSPGSVATVGVTAIAGQVTNVYAVVPDEAGDVAQAEAFFASVDEHLQGARDAAAAWGEEGPQARPTFTVAYRGDDGPLSDEQVQPVLDLAARTLSRFGQLVPTS